MTLTPYLNKLCAFALISFGTSNALANVALVKQDGFKPWLTSPANPGSHESAMNTAFGAGNWDNLSFEHVNASTLFSSAYSFIFLEGSSESANNLEAFLATNNTLIENWVINGGRLFINSAPNEGDGMDLGFGLTLNYTIANDFVSFIGTAADSSHAIFNGPNGATGSEFTGGVFSHASVTGANLNPLMSGFFNVGGGTGVILGELSYGSGHVIVGGMSVPSFHRPQPEATILLANILSYGAAIPEPSTYALFGAAGLVGLIAVRRRKN